MATASAKSAAKAKSAGIIINLDDFRDILEAAKDEGQPEGWYTSTQIKDALKCGVPVMQNFIRTGVVNGSLEMNKKYWMDWDGVNRLHRVYRVTK